MAKKLEKERPLNLKQELFCQMYATDREFFGNGVECYIEVYEPDQKKPNWYKTACSSASQMLSNIKVLNRINELIDASGLNDAHVDKQLYMVVTQSADLKSKVAAIREYNNLRQRITKKLDVTSDGEKIEPLVVYIPEEYPDIEKHDDLEG